MLASCGRHRRDYRRVRQRSVISGSGRATTATAVMMLCSLLGFSLQGVVCATEVGADSVGAVAVAFVAQVGGSRARSPRICSSSSDPTATSKPRVARLFNTRRCHGHGLRGPVVNSAFTSVTSCSGRRARRVNPSRVVTIQLAAINTADEDTSRSCRRIDTVIDATAVDAVPADDPSQPATETDSRLLQPTPYSLIPVPSTTRLDYLKHCSVRALVIAGAASSAVSMLDPPSAADAYSPPSTATRDMVWLDEDSGTVSSKLSQVDETYGRGFVAYLARFLLNYDEGCQEYFNGRLDLLVPQKDGSHVWEEFQVRCIGSVSTIVFISAESQLLHLLHIRPRLGGMDHFEYYCGLQTFGTTIEHCLLKSCGTEKTCSKNFFSVKKISDEKRTSMRRDLWDRKT